MESLHDVLPRTADLIAADYEAGQHKGFQLYVSLRGEVIANAASGEASPGVPMQVETLVPWFSAGKPLTVIAIGRLWQQGQLQLDDRIATSIPEFAAAGKQDVTIRHLLTHTGGFPNVETGYPEVSWQESLMSVYDAPVERDWEIGKSAGYHMLSSWFILGELIRRVSLEDSFETVIGTEVLEPFDLRETRFAVTEGELDAARRRLGWTWRRVGKSLEPLDWHEPPRILRASPGSSARGPMSDLGRFYEKLIAMLAGDDGPCTPQTVEAMTSPHRVGEFDRTFQHIVDFGLGFLVNSNRYGTDTVPYGFGRHASPRAFGHGGAQSSIGFADPEHGLVVAWAANARIGEPRHNARNRAINTAIYEDLGLDKV